MATRTKKLALTKAQIGRCGELLVQYRLLLLGIESAPMSTDTGVDLVAYLPGAVAMTIQVKTNLKPKPAGGKGKATLDWRLSERNPAQLVAVVDLETERVWVFSDTEFRDLAQQRNGGAHHLYMVVDPAYRPPKGTAKATRVYEFERYLLENRAPHLLG
jgi:hypothetical protein